MTKYQILKIRETGRLALTTGQLFWHYSIVLFLLIVPVLTTIDVFKYYITKSYDGVRPIEDLVTYGYIWLLPAIAFYFIQRGRVRFKVIVVAVTPEAFVKAAEETAKELEWDIVEQTKTSVVAISGFSWRSWGERITIVWDKDKILINSICDPDNRPSVTSFGMNRLNIKTFESHLSNQRLTPVFLP